MNTTAIKLIIFDYDGVIVDSFPVYHQIYELICRRFNKHWPADIEEFKTIYAGSSKEYYKNAGFSEQEILEATKIIKEELPKHEPAIYEGISETLSTLRGRYRLAVISSSPHEEVEQRLKAFGLYTYFDFVFGRPAHQLSRMVKTEYMRNVMADLGLEPSQVLLIGDRNVDFTEGSDAGLTNIILVKYGWGYDPKKIPDYQEPGVLINKPADLLKVIKLIN